MSNVVAQPRERRFEFGGRGAVVTRRCARPSSKLRRRGVLVRSLEVDRSRRSKNALSKPNVQFAGKTWAQRPQTWSKAFTLSMIEFVLASSNVEPFCPSNRVPKWCSAAAR